MDYDELVYKVYPKNREFIFLFLITSSRNVELEKLKIDLRDLEKHINKHLETENFGDSVKSFELGFEIFDFTESLAKDFQKTKNYYSYRHKHKRLIVVEQFDYAKLISVACADQLEIISNGIIRTIEGIKTRSNKPRKFDIDSFREKMNSILKEYEC